MKSNNHLESFITAIDNQESPDGETLKKVADSLKAVQKGLSFKAAFKITNKRGRKPVKAISEKKLEEVKPYLDAVQEYYEKVKQGGSAEVAKAEICKKHGICERTFDDYRAGYNKIKKIPFLELKPLLGKIPGWQIMAIICKSNFDSAQDAMNLSLKFEATLPQFREELQEFLVSRNYDPLVQENISNVEAALLKLIENGKEQYERAQKLKKIIPAF